MPLAPLQEHDVRNEDAPSVCAAKGWSRQPPRSPPWLKLSTASQHRCPHYDAAQSRQTP